MYVNVCSLSAASAIDDKANSACLSRRVAARRHSVYTVIVPILDQKIIIGSESPGAPAPRKFALRSLVKFNWGCESRPLCCIFSPCVYIGEPQRELLPLCPIVGTECLLSVCILVCSFHHSELELPVRLFAASKSRHWSCVKMFGRTQQTRFNLLWNLLLLYNFISILMLERPNCYVTGGKYTRPAIPMLQK